MRIRGFGRTSAERIEVFQTKYAVVLPTAYIRFLQEKNGGVVNVNDAAITVPSLHEQILMDIFYGLDIEEDCLNIEYWMDRYSMELPANSVVIGRDHLNGFIVIICKGEDEGIYYWDDKFNFPQSNTEGCAYLISDDLNSISELFC